MKLFILSIFMIFIFVAAAIGQGHLDPKNDDWGVGSGGGINCPATFNCTGGGSVSCNSEGSCTVTSNGVICYEPDGTATSASCP